MLRSDVSVWWIASVLFSMVYTAWETVTMGVLAPADASRLTYETALAGLAHLSTTSAQDR